MSWLEPFGEVENCYLTTTGRRTGKAHEIEIWFGTLGSTLYLISGNGPTADWYRNLIAVSHPHGQRAGERTGVRS